MSGPSASTLVDSNVLLDVLTKDPRWSAWSERQLSAALERGPVLINPIIYAEVSPRFSTLEELDATLSEERFLRAQLPWTSAFLAARAHRAYRGRGGSHAATLPDFFIGAHAAVLRIPLLTRDAARYRTYFPTVELIAP
jgi:predicted nucleic acid-binding protein